MSYIDFSTNEYVNVAIIDEQHKNIADIINNIYDSLPNNNTDTVKVLLNKLVEDVEIHFETEEKLMKDKSFHGYFSHKLEHDRFYKQLVQIVDAFNKSAEVISEDKMNSLKRWFFNHIEIKDKKCGEFLNSIGIK